MSRTFPYDCDQTKQLKKYYFGVSHCECYTKLLINPTEIEFAFFLLAILNKISLSFTYLRIVITLF